jgi:micrococcal nuclease
LVLVVLLSFAAPAFAQTSQTSTVERIVDGDTIEVDPAVPGTESVRLIGVDTPEPVDPGEPVQPYGPQASAFTKHLGPGEDGPVR